MGSHTICDRLGRGKVCYGGGGGRVRFIFFLLSIPKFLIQTIQLTTNQIIIPQWAILEQLYLSPAVNGF